jgi:hypothetical protein
VRGIAWRLPVRAIPYALVALSTWQAIPRQEVYSARNESAGFTAAARREGT